MTCVVTTFESSCVCEDCNDCLGLEDLVVESLAS